MKNVSLQSVERLPAFPVDCSKPARVLFVDYWTKGIHNFKRIIEATEPGKASFQLFHLGSFRDRSVPRIDIVEGLPCADIAAFRGMKLEGILESLRPDVVVDLNMGTLFDRVLYLTCSRLRIPTLFVQHGMYLDHDAFLESCQETDRSWKIGDFLRRVPKYSTLVPWYIRARGGISRDADLWKVLWGQLTSPTVSTFFPIAPHELWPTLALVFNQINAEEFNKKFNLPAGRLRVVGNPELDAAIRRRNAPLNPEERAALVESIGLDPRIPILFYAEEGLAETNKFGWNRSIRADLLRELYASCRLAGVQLLFRPRQSEFFESGFPFQSQEHVVITRAVSLVDSIDISAVALGAISTVLETAVVLRKPILVPRWYLGGLSLRSPFLKFNAAAEVRSPEDLVMMITKAVHGEIQIDATEYTATRLGPLDGSASERIAIAMLDLARETMSIKESQ